ncbi:sulfide:quinone oxidoreductase, mitochondrial isoform X2 [Plutella xylostella]|uniref:sulfide:quinone oxidoreductase, mitochondrial isoform X1 n=1 Tax=Plutella xylostella TaxID=51655 RepID=UPI0020326911|nr:sulfide:quinone oxidoreductase, mitochondrial isoform X1 [Plutella xylostella]XP_048482631.1 sulfide:quinone oxidoreductase, mitochondrial isoform X2 [Plutella xylostella]
MANLIRNICTRTPSASSSFHRAFSVSSTNNKNYSCKLLVVGGGSGGCTIANKFARRLGKDAVIVVEPSKDHYYQPLWTLVGAGVKRVADTRRPARSVLPAAATWVVDRAACLHPERNKLVTEEGHEIEYEYVVVATGIDNDYDKIPGLKQALDDIHSGVSTIYSAEYCEKTWRDLQLFTGGDAIFTFPDTPIKCPGAPQKIAYMTDAYFEKKNIRSKANIHYNTFLPVIFGIKKYADELLKVAARKNISVNYRTLLTAVHGDRKEATFVVKDADGKQVSESTVPYDLLHVTPAMRTPEFLRTNTALVDKTGFLDVDKYSLQHKKYKNMYGIGDCTNTPNSKTAAAIAKQCYVLEQNLLKTMKQDTPYASYDGYGACPLVTSYNTCILAEFLYDGVVHETFPFDQVSAKESRLAYYLKRDMFPFIYWNAMLKGYYHGPEFVRTFAAPLARLAGKKD